MVHYYWIGAIPAMVFLGVVMMPFYYGSKVRSVPEYMLLRYDKKAHLINAISFVAGSLLIAGVNLFALATVLRALLGVLSRWPSSWPRSSCSPTSSSAASRAPSTRRSCSSS